MRRFDHRACARIALVLALGAGCATTAKSASSDDLETLRRSVKAYNEAFRWKNFERAASFLPKDMRLAFIATHEDDEKNLHVEEYQILQVRLSGERAAKVELRVTYMMLPSVVVKTRRITQHWHLIDDQWVLETEDNPIRVVRKDAKPQNPDAFGGVDEPEGDSKDTGVRVTDPEGNVIRDDRPAAGMPDGVPPPPPPP